MIRSPFDYRTTRATSVQTKDFAINRNISAGMRRAAAHSASKVCGRLATTAEAACGGRSGGGGSVLVRASDDGEVGASSARWVDDAWVGTVGWCDTMLRCFYRIREFTDDPACVLRVAFGRARTTVSLSDGTRVVAGEPIGTLHLWNEHLPRHPARAPGLGWACEMRHQVVHSLEALARYVQTERVWLNVRAFHAESALSTRLGPPQVERIIRRYGFEAMAPDRSPMQRLHDFGDDFLLWGLARAFNPAALRRMRFFRDHQELWISRISLMRIYLPGRECSEIGAIHHGDA